LIARKIDGDKLTKRLLLYCF